MKHITVREYARLTTEELQEASLDLAQISPKAFDWLCRLQGSWGNDVPVLVSIDGSFTLKLNSYVGVLETPCGTRIEILPKTHTTLQSEVRSRELLCRMLQVVRNLPVREAQDGHLQIFPWSIAEWLIHHFLTNLFLLLKRGLSSGYKNTDDELGVIRGQINIPRQAFQLPHRQHLTHLRYNQFSMDRPENRLIRSALGVCLSSAQDGENLRIARSLDEWMQAIPSSPDVRNDFRLWQQERHMGHYAQIKPWCELILNSFIPVTTVGQWQGISLLFPMEKLFEAFVTCCLKRVLPAGSRMYCQITKKYLCEYQGKEMFRLIPDMLVEYGDGLWVLDVKWKLLDLKRRNLGLQERDFYQMLAYGYKHIGNKWNGELALIYPKTDSFVGLPELFSFSPDLNLHVLAFDLQESISMKQHTVITQILSKNIFPSGTGIDSGA